MTKSALYCTGAAFAFAWLDAGRRKKIGAYRSDELGLIHGERRGEVTRGIRPARRPPLLVILVDRHLIRRIVMPDVLHTVTELVTPKVGHGVVDQITVCAMHDSGGHHGGRRIRV